LWQEEAVAANLGGGLEDGGGSERQQAEAATREEDGEEPLLGKGKFASGNVSGED
jgi:hypothetical protein